MKKIIISCALILSMSSCSITTYYAQNESANHTPTTAENIELYSFDSKKNYEVLGSIAVDAIGDAESAETCIKKKAAKIGADAIVFCKLSKLNSSAARTGISGVAIKYN